MNYSQVRRVSVALIVAVTSVGVVTRAAGQAVNVVVVTASGPVVGSVRGGIAAFKGIPYAAPPTGARRWQAPAPAIPWNSPLVAADYGASCPQRLPIRGAPTGSRANTVNEDCLTLNIWTPAPHAGALPVMIWMHGGGNIEGTASRTLYDGGNFARDSVVLVSFNYRLGLLGFFAHPALTREAGATPTANFGLLDQLAAIRWVRRNIAAFGGDTSNITIFGESAGGQDVLALLTSRMARGLFARAIAESPGGGWQRAPTLAEAERAGVQLAASLGVNTASASDALRALPVDSLVAHADADTGPIIDGQLLTEPPLQAFADGQADAVPLIIGTNSDEGSLLGDMAHPAALFPRRLDGPALAAVRALYGAPASTDAAFAALLFRDAYFAGPVRRIATHEARNAPVYLYRFDYVVTPFRASRLGATHGSELPFVFGNWPIPLRIPADQAMQAAMHDCWVAFARRGAPVCAGLPGWSAYQPANGELMLINNTPGMQDNPVAAVLDRLDSLMHR
jgi:para-nitrobenzyl esterase